MVKGIKPIIHNFVGAKTIYKNDYVWNTMDEAVSMIKNNVYNSKEYIKCIEKNYSLNKQIYLLKYIIKEIENYNNIFEFRYEGTDISFYLPYLNDWVQKVIYQTRNFY